MVLQYAKIKSWSKLNEYCHDVNLLPVVLSSLS